jgi:hypothetical protein
MGTKIPVSLITDFVKKNHKLITLSEKFSVVLFTLGLFLYFLGISNADLVIITGSILTAITYFLFAFKTVEVENLEPKRILNSSGFINFIYKPTNLALSMTAIASLGLVVKPLQNRPIIFASGITLIFSLTISLLTKVNDRLLIYNSTYYIKIVLALLLIIYLADIHYNFL